jgi:hypothetical protein
MNEVIMAISKRISITKWDSTQHSWHRVSRSISFFFFPERLWWWGVDSDLNDFELKIKKKKKNSNHIKAICNTGARQSCELHTDALLFYFLFLAIILPDAWLYVVLNSTTATRNSVIAEWGRTKFPVRRSRTDVNYTQEVMMMKPDASFKQNSNRFTFR